MYKTIFLLERDPALSPEAFRSRWLNDHLPIVLRIGAVRGFVCNVVSSSSASPSPYDGMAEIWWDDEAAFEAALASPEGQAAVADVASFTTSHDHVVLEETVALPPPEASRPR